MRLKKIFNKIIDLFFQACSTKIREKRRKVPFNAFNIILQFPKYQNMIVYNC